MGDSYGRWWRREGQKGRFRYRDAAGREVSGEKQLARIAKLRIPPGWTDVRVSPSPRAKVQAVGLDAKGRRQYVYHADWIERQSAEKYDRLVRFVQALPHFREEAARHLSEPGLGKEKVIALVTRLIAEGCFRVGGERYAKENASYGISTLCNQHLEIGETVLRFHFRGKKGVWHARVIPDADVVALMREVRDLPGARLFQYVGEDGAIGRVTGRDVNAYIKAVMGPEFSAKDFRTWGGTLLAARVLAAYGPRDGVTARKRVMVATTRAVARFLGNTPAIAKASYISPKVFAAYERGLTLKDLAPGGRREVRLLQKGYTCEEIEIMEMLTIPPGRPAARITMAPVAPVTAKGETPA